MGEEPRGSEAVSRLVAYQVGPGALPLRKAVPRRDWLDALPERFGYRCLPLVIADQAGWDALCPAGFTAVWNGGSGREDLQVRWAEGQWSRAVRSHFGNGILTFGLGYVFRTPPGVNLLVCGPPNWPKDGVHALAGVVETDWSPTTFTMNYLFTRPHQEVRFEAGEPVCRLIPLERHLEERLEPELRLMEDDPELEARYRGWEAKRARFIEQARVHFSEASEQRWQKDYFQGRPELGPCPPDHQTSLRHREFTDLRPPEQRGTPGPAAGRSAQAGGADSATYPPAHPTNPVPEEDYSVLAATALLRDLTERQRMQVLGRFCSRCGRLDPACPCRPEGAQACHGGG
jgi:hypothetical protein